jgi:hypothetical protein
MRRLLGKVDVEELCQVRYILFIGQHVAVDPRGRAVMIAAIEKQKFVYVLTRE